MTTRKTLSLILVGFIFTGLFIQYQIRAPRRNFSDYPCFYKAGKDMQQGKNPYIKESQEIADYKYPPIFALFMALLANLGLRASASLYFILNLCAVFFIFRFSRKLIFLKSLSPGKEFLLFAVVGVMNFRFILNCLHCGQVGLFIALALVAGLYLISGKRNVTGSFLIGLAVMIKYMPALFLPYFFIKKRFKVTFLILLSVFIYCLLPGLFIGFKANLLLLKELFPVINSSSLGEGFLYNSKSQSLWTLPFRFMPGISSFASVLVTLVLFAILSLFIIIGNKKNSASVREGFYNCVDYGLIFILIPLFNPYAWLHNFVTLIFTTMLALYYLLLNNFKDKVVLSLLLVYFILSSIGSPSLVGRTVQGVLERFPTLVFAMFFLFAALVKIKFASKIALDKEK